MKKQTLAALTILSAGMIAGCGSSGSDTSMSSSMMTPVATSASVSGAVADGYLEKATVFLDKNLNYRLDTGEPSAITDQNGAYTLHVDAADIGKYPIVALATQGVTIDKDTNTAVTGSYVLSMHAVAVAPATGGVTGTVSNFISPMSTQLREMMETGSYTTLQQAMDALRTQVGLPAGTNMMSDYIAGRNTAMHTAARNMATLMGGQAGQVIGTNGTVDVNRYRGMMGTIYSNLPTITGSNAQTNITTLRNTMNTNLSFIPAGMPFRNYSTVYRGGMGMGMMWR